MDRDDILHAIENCLFFDSCFFKYFPVSTISMYPRYISKIESPGVSPGHTHVTPKGCSVRIMEDDDIILVHDVVREHNTGDVLRDPAEVPGKEERGTGDPVTEW